MEQLYCLTALLAALHSLQKKLLPAGSILPFRLPLLPQERLLLRRYPGPGCDYGREVLETLLPSLFLLPLNLFLDPAWLLLTLALMAWLRWRPFGRRKAQMRKWEGEFRRRYPLFLSRLKMNLRGGLTLDHALEASFLDFQGGKHLGALEECLIQIRRGESRQEALGEGIRRSGQRELMRLMDFLLRQWKLGGEDLGYLDQLGHEAWKVKKETVRRTAEEGSAKMALPMMLIFLSVIILVLVPSILSLGG